MILLDTASDYDINDFTDDSEQLFEKIRQGWASYMEMFNSTGADRVIARIVMVVFIMIVVFIVCLMIFTNFKRFKWEHPTLKKARKAEALGQAVDAVLVKNDSDWYWQDAGLDSNGSQKRERKWYFCGYYKYTVNGREYKYKYTKGMPPDVLRLYWLKDPGKPFMIVEQLSNAFGCCIIGIPIIAGIIAALLLGLFGGDTLTALKP